MTISIIIGSMRDKRLAGQEKQGDLIWWTSACKTARER
jgi:hypothetical protein